MDQKKHIILFDGVCNLCDSTIQYIIKHDRKNLFYFAPLQGKTASQLLHNNKSVTFQPNNSIVYSVGDKFYIKSTAVLNIVLKLGFPRNLSAVFLITPPFIRDHIYDYIAKNRYRWFGRKDSCMLLTPDLKEKFLD
ncbi:thiol-disulfide oxidoreductase DCC family protein [Flammeovirga sp. SJP92]|uniref:thiol-disulfide oxidoreductase DCC family protein n=1 Tax=Flammeovirga sp. SJP92 TaxID=1775430 RepID=UPI000786E2EC|nr:DCC1-like thiol-disulfide oxidoreductase family protein [Flammeovirga sp. SJP92]KXX72609.1 thiol-disulfide oxidoreductase [Flammeovirga sp. SJP92]